MQTIKVVLTFESVDGILLYDHSNETSSAVLSHGTIIYIKQYFTKWNLGFVLNFDLGTLGRKRVKGNISWV